MPENNTTKLLMPLPLRASEARPKAEKVETKNIKRVPSPFISKQAAALNISLIKQLGAYPNYGNPSKSADILYTGSKGAWDIEIPHFLLNSGSLKAKLIIRAVLDDHAGVSPGSYAARIYANGALLHRGRLPLEHGTPVGNVFTNWKELSFILRTPVRENKIVIENISACGARDWIGFDRMELRLYPA